MLTLVRVSFSFCPQANAAGVEESFGGAGRGSGGASSGGCSGGASGGGGLRCSGFESTSGSGGGGGGVKETEELLASAELAHEIATLRGLET